MLRKLLIAVVVLAVVAAALLGVAYWQATAVVAQMQAGPKAAVVRSVAPELHRKAKRALVKLPPEPQAQTILLIGSDHRWGDRTGARSDTILLARVEPKRKRIALLSIPRDLYVPIAGHGYDRINQAFALGGERLLTRTVREVFGVEIDHFVEVDFHGFKDLVAALGGVYLPVDRRYYNRNVGTPGTDYANIDLQPGYQRLDPAQALAFARYRHTDSDLVRAARQQLLIRTAAHQALAGDWNPFRIRRLALAFARATASDISSLGELYSLAQAVRSTPPSRIVRLTVPAEDFVLGGADYLRASEAQLKSAVERWLGAGPRAHRRPAPARREAVAAVHLAGLVPDGGRGASLLGSVRDGIRTCTPTELPPHFFWPSTEPARRYVVAGHPAIALDASGDVGESVLWMFTTWSSPPTLRHPSETVELHGRAYDLYLEGGRVRQVAWRLGATRAWITNTLEDSLGRAQMLALAASCR